MHAENIDKLIKLNKARSFAMIMSFLNVDARGITESLLFKTYCPSSSLWCLSLIDLRLIIIDLICEMTSLWLSSDESLVV